VPVFASSEINRLKRVEHAWGFEIVKFADNLEPSRITCIRILGLQVHERFLSRNSENCFGKPRYSTVARSVTSVTARFPSQIHRFSRIVAKERGHRTRLLCGSRLSTPKSHSHENRPALDTMAAASVATIVSKTTTVVAWCTSMPIYLLLFNVASLLGSNADSVERLPAFLLR
jgi:hypothetical protein